jgi:Domain of unknown function (DUF4136)
MRLAVFALGSAALLAIACAGIRVRTDYDPAIDFAPLQTFRWIDPPLREEARTEPGADPFTHNTLIDKRVREDVEAWLTSHGYRAASASDEPDFLVRYEVVAQEVTRDSPVFITGGVGRYGYDGYAGSGVGYAHSTTYQEGTLILDVIDPSTRQITWRGWGTSPGRDAHMEPDRLRETVAAILGRFPPKPRAD